MSIIFKYFYKRPENLNLRYQSHHSLKRLLPWNELTKTKPADNVLVYGGDENWDIDKGHVVGWKSAGSLLD